MNLLQFIVTLYSLAAPRLLGELRGEVQSLNMRVGLSISSGVNYTELHFPFYIFYNKNTALRSHKKLKSSYTLSRSIHPHRIDESLSGVSTLQRTGVRCVCVGACLIINCRLIITAVELRADYLEDMSHWLDPVGPPLDMIEYRQIRL